ncbi:MAG TPA: dihydropteroate synthase [Syntrophobacteraceae bacterium]|nr:dihydropteroate synthase [Syntrophobacteraceae bacterium]
MSVSPRKTFRLELGDRVLELGSRTLIMGILNVTPDSFSDGGRFSDFPRAVEHARELIAAGADILDVGGESTRPDADGAPLDIELDRVIPVIESVRKFSDVPISIDTTKAEVARQALRAGANLVNDVSALRFDNRMTDVLAATKAPVILMHMQGSPKTMQKQPFYHSLLSEILAFLEERIQYAVDHGVSRSQILVDPGIGFGKNVSHNLRLIRDLDLLHCLDRPILLGASRKRFIGAVLDKSVDDREVGTAVANSFAIHAGVHILRVHDVAYHRQVVRMGDALRSCPDFGETTG